MSYEAKITQVYTTNDGVTMFSFAVYDSADPDTILTTHTQGIAAEMERIATPSKRVVVKRKDDGSGDPVLERDAYGALVPVMVEEDYDEMVESGRWIAPPVETIHEAICNFVRDVLPLRTTAPSISVGQTFEV